MTTVWPGVRLGEVCEIVSGSTPKTGDPSLWGGDICWVTPKDLSDLRKKYIGDTPRKLTAKGLRSCSAPVLPPGSVLLSSRAPIGLVAINTVPMATNQGFKSLVPDARRLDAGFLYRWLDGNRAFLQSLGRGATFKEISKTITAEIQLPLPPIQEQRRIAAILDQAVELRARRQASVALIDSLDESLFLDMFGDPLSNPFGWPANEPLGDVADIASGVTKGRRLGKATTRPVQYLAVANVQAGYLRLDGVKVIEATDDEIAHYRLVPGDLVLTEGGDPDKLGRGTVWAGQIDERIHQNHIFRAIAPLQRWR